MSEKTRTNVPELWAQLSYPLRVWGQTAFSALQPPINRRRRRQMFEAGRILDQRLPTVSIDEVLGAIDENAVVSMRALQSRPHNCSTLELFALAAITRLIAPRRALEIGTYDGRSTLAIALNTAGEVYTMNLPAEYFEQHPDEQHLVDVALSKKVRSGERITGPEAARIHAIFANSRAYDFSTLAPIQLAFIDGGHDVVTVRSDTENVLRILDRQDSAILWDDATLYGVGEYLPTLPQPIHLIEGTDMAILRFKHGEPVTWR